MRRFVFVVISSLCCWALGGCSGEGPVRNASPHTKVDAAPISTSASPSTASPEPAHPPRMPALAKERSPAGAKAFVRYYVAVLNYSWHSGHSTLTRRYSAPGCVSCRGIARSIEQMTQAGGFYRGGAWRLKAPVLVPSQPGSAPIVHAALIQSSGHWKKSAADRLRVIKRDQNYLDVHLIRKSGTWKVTSMVFA